MTDHLREQYQTMTHKQKATWHLGTVVWKKPVHLAILRLWSFLGWWKRWPFQGLSDLHLGDQKGYELNHLGVILLGFLKENLRVLTQWYKDYSIAKGSWWAFIKRLKRVNVWWRIFFYKLLPRLPHHFDGLNLVSADLWRIWFSFFSGGWTIVKLLFFVQKGVPQKILSMMTSTYDLKWREVGLAKDVRVASRFLGKIQYLD